MTDVGALLDNLHDWIVGFDPAGKTFADFEREMGDAHAELFRLSREGRLDDEASGALGVIMSLAEARHLLRTADQDPDALILRDEADPPTPIP